MVEFGKRLADECAQHGIEWQNHCIDYNELKNIILEAKQQQQQQQQQTTTSIATTTKAKSKSQRNRTVSFDARNEHDFLFTAIRTSGGYDIDNVNDEPALFDDNNDNEYSSSSLSTSLLISSLQFRYALDREIEKAVLYVLQEQGSIALELDTLAVRRAGYADRTYMLVNNRGGDNTYGSSSSSVASSNIIINAALEELQQLHGGYVLVARSVLSFVAFVDLNVTVSSLYFLLQ